MSLYGKVYVGDLGNNAVKADIEEKFEKFGPLRDVWVARNPPGFAFVVFEDPRDADDAVRELDGTYCCGQRIRVDHARARSPGRGGRSYRGGGGGRYGGGGGGRYSGGYGGRRSGRSDSYSPPRRRRSYSRSPPRRSRHSRSPRRY